MFQLKLKLDLQYFAYEGVTNEQAVTYAELTDEHIKDIKKNLELFVPSEEYWDKFAHHSIVPRGHREFTSRRLIAPKIKEADISPRAEFVAPRPTKIAVETFTKTVANYGDKAIYSKEDLQFHFDNTVNSITATLKEIAVQKRDLIKGKPFINSRAIITAESGTSPLIDTAKKAAIILRKNKVKRWANGLYLAHVTPECLQKLQEEIEAKGVSIPEKIKVTVNGKLEELDHYGDFMYSVTDSDLLYKSASVQRIVYMGRRGIDNESPVDVAKLSGESEIELINKGLGTGILVDVDGKLTTDDNNQQGVVALNMDGLGAAVSDDLAILNCEVSVNEIAKTTLAEAAKTGFVSVSGNEVELTLTGTTYTELVPSGYASYNATSGKYYASKNSVLKVQVKAAANKTLGTVTTANWTASYNSGSNTVPIQVFLKTVKDNDTIYIEIPEGVKGALTIACAATAS